jgi:hypothetical protein
MPTVQGVAGGVAYESGLTPNARPFNHARHYLPQADHTYHDPHGHEDHSCHMNDLMLQKEISNPSHGRDVNYSTICTLFQNEISN